MKRNNLKKGLAILMIAFARDLTVLAQVTPAMLKQLIAENRHSHISGIRNAIDIKRFYELSNFKPAWIEKDNSGNCTVFLNILTNAANLGLGKKDYQFDLIVSVCGKRNQLQNVTDSLEAEIRITDAAIHFFMDLIHGKTKPPLSYNGLNYTPGCRDIPRLLAEYISKNSLSLLIAHLPLPLGEVIAMEKKLRWFNALRADSNFREIIITSGKVSGANMPLILKLHQLGIIESLNKKPPDSLLKDKVKEAQRQFNLPPDGKLYSTILKELNISLSSRVQQLVLSLNYYRWLYCLTQNQTVIVVNIPSAYLKVYRGREVILEMRMVLGKRSTPTPTLSSTVNEVILYPYWHVPQSIATRELLPAIKRNPGFINAGNYQVLDREGRILNPYSVNWNALSTKYFPYVIRQSTGCDNALGLLKLNFYNPYGVYLHDTPGKNLFSLNKRYFSHGCMRMEKPMQLGHLVLKNNHIAIDTLEQKGCLRNQSPVIVHADIHMPVIVWYNPAGIDSTGRVLFFEDVYERFTWMK